MAASFARTAVMSLANGQHRLTQIKSSLPSGDSVDNGNAEPEDKIVKNHRHFHLIAVVAVVVAAIGGAVYWFMHDDTEKSSCRSH